MTFAEFKSQVKALAFPKGEARNLVAVHDDFIKSGLEEIQRWVPCFRASNIQVYPQCSSLYKCGVSVFDLPDGVLELTKVYTTDKTTHCGEVQYLPETFDWINREAAHYIAEYGAPTAPGQHGATPLPLGFLYADSSSNTTQGRAVRGWYAVKDNELYVWPFTESYEDLVLEWLGVRKDYAATDVVYSSDRLVKEAVRKYLRMQIASEIMCNEEDRAKYQSQFNNDVATMIWECRKKISLVQPSLAVRTIPASVMPFDVPTADTATSDEANTQVWAVIGDYGQVGGAEAAAVAALVKTWDPAFIVTTGDNSYPDGSTIDAAIGPLYRKFIYPYTGSQALQTGESDATTNLFWPSLGNHDWDSSGAAPYLAYFTLPNNERYYTKVLGNVQLFVVDSGFNTAGVNQEVDGNTSLSPQAEWLGSSLAASTATWKIVVFHHPPYSNGTAHSSTVSMRWNFDAMGADLVLNGHSHNYERLSVSGFPYVVCGASGRTPLDTFTGTTNSVVQYSADWGACRVTTDCSSLVLEFVNRAGTVVDTLTLTK